MRIRSINESNRAVATDLSNKIAQLKPPLHTVQQHRNRNEDAINEIMEDHAVPHKADALSGTKQQNQNDASVNDNNFVEDDNDDFMTRIVDGTCRGIFSSTGNNEDDHDRPSLCHIPSCHLGENLNVLMVCSLFIFDTMSLKTKSSHHDST